MIQKNTRDAKLRGSMMARVYPQAPPTRGSEKAASRFRTESGSMRTSEAVTTTTSPRAASTAAATAARLPRAATMVRTAFPNVSVTFIRV